MSEKFIVPKEPRLHWNTLFSSFRRNEPLAWLDKKPIHQFFWARNAIYNGLSALGVMPGENILVPSFHCTSLVEPILKYGAGVKFYNVGLDVRPDLADIEKKIDQKSRAILAIHYCGFPLPISSIKTLCRKHGLYFIEDCAHVLIGSTTDGTVLGGSGDISVFSWRKFLPIHDGGQLVINNPELDFAISCDSGGFLLALKVAKDAFDKLIEPSSFRWCWPIALPSRLLHRWMDSNVAGGSALKVNNYDLEFDPASANLQMSNLSKRILRHTDIDQVIRKRRRNYDRINDAVRTMKGVAPLYPTLPGNICPWVFPLVVNQTKNLHLGLRARGIPATTWGGVIHPSLPLDEFPSARFLYENLVFLPIHQDMEEQHFEVMTKILDEVLHEKLQVRKKSFDGRLSLSTL